MSTNGIKPGPRERAVDVQQAARHIARLTGAPNGLHVDVTFQTFDDNKTPGHKPNKSLARTIHGSLEERVAELNSFQARGAGVFITVNLTKGRRRRNIDVIEGRAAFIEDDKGANLNPGIAPQLVIQSSPNKEHRYFLTKTSDLARLSRVQESLVQDFGSDPNAKDLARVLRLAGSWHLKDPAQPHRVCILKCTDAPPYSWDDIEKAIPLLVEPSLSNGAAPASPMLAAQPPATDAAIIVSEDVIRDLRSALPFVDADTREKWIKIGHALKSLGVEGFRLYEAYSRYSPKFYDVADFRAQPGENAELAAQIALSHQKVHKAVARKIQELSDGGLSPHEVVAATGFPAPLVKLVLRGGGAERSAPPPYPQSRLRGGD